MNKEGTQTDEPKDQKKLMIMHKVLHLRDDIDGMNQEEKEEEVSPALRIV